MKVTATREVEEFTPIHLTIEIESLEELKALWGRLNMDNRTINTKLKEWGNLKAVTSEELWPLYKMIDEFYRESVLRT